MTGISAGAENAAEKYSAPAAASEAVDARCALGADLLYEQRNTDALLHLLPALAPEVLLADPGRPHAGDFFARAAEDWSVERTAGVYRLRRRLRRRRRR